MNKKLRLQLNKYDPIPNTLRVESATNVAVSEIHVDTARLYHHYYLDSRGYAPPFPDPARFEHLDLLLPCVELRARGDGFGVNSAFRQHRANELGQAFCRWFLYEHLRITYFAHMQAVLNRKLHPGFGGLRVERVQTGDAPDYLCARNTSTVFLGEAKGRTSSISFTNSEFKSWRNQFDRVVVRNSAGTSLSVKGHIVATRFVTEKNTASLKSCLFAEDPNSPGRQELPEAPGLASMVLALHYAEIAAKIQQPLLSSALASGVPVPTEIQFPAAVWEFQSPPLHGRRFVGGYFPGPNGVAPIRLDEGKLTLLSENPFRLDVAAGTFFGVEEKIFKGMCAMARSGDQSAQQLPQMEEVPLLRDGSVIGPLQYFRPVTVQVY